MVKVKDGLADLKQFVASAGDDKGQPYGLPDLDLLQQVDILLHNWLDLRTQLICNLCSSPWHSCWHLASKPATQNLYYDLYARCRPLDDLLFSLSKSG